MYVSEPEHVKMVERLLDINPDMLPPLAELMVWNYYNDKEKYDHIIKEYSQADLISLSDVDYDKFRKGLTYSHTE